METPNRHLGGCISPSILTSANAMTIQNEYLDQLASTPVSHRKIQEMNPANLMMSQSLGIMNVVGTQRVAARSPMEANILPPFSPTNSSAILKPISILPPGYHFLRGAPYFTNAVLHQNPSSAFYSTHPVNQRLAKDEKLNDASSPPKLGEKLQQNEIRSSPKDSELLQGSRMPNAQKQSPRQQFEEFAIELNNQKKTCARASKKANAISSKTSESNARSKRGVVKKQTWQKKAPALHYFSSLLAEALHTFKSSKNYPLSDLKEKAIKEHTENRRKDSVQGLSKNEKEKISYRIEECLHVLHGAKVIDIFLKETSSDSEKRYFRIPTKSLSKSASFKKSGKKI